MYTTSPDNDPRFPYTYAADFIREAGPVDKGGVVLSRADASNIIDALAKALDEDEYELRVKLAEAQLKNESDSTYLRKQSDRLLRALGYGAPHVVKHLAESCPTSVPPPGDKE